MSILRLAGDLYRDADAALGGFLPFGGTASPITAASQQAQRGFDERIRQRIAERDAEPGTPGRFAGKGPILSAVQSIVDAGANPLGVATGEAQEVGKVADFYKANPDLQNQYDLNTNLFLRYLSGTGTEGLKVAPEVGQQLYSDILEQEQKFPADVRQALMRPGLEEWQKQRLAAADTPVYYSGTTETRRDKKLPSLATDVGERGQLRNSLGSFWSSLSPDGPERLIDDRYDFVYAPKEKGGFRDYPKGRNFGLTPADFGRRLVQAGYGNPFDVRLKVNPKGEVNVRG